MKKSILLFILALFSIEVSSQRLSQTVIAPEGGSSTSGSITLEWTLGELAVESVATGNRLYTQGFHQPISVKIFYQPPVSLLPEPGFEIIVAPNPVQSLLMIYSTSTMTKSLRFTLSDITGKKLWTRSNVAATSVNRIDMTGIVTGLYILNVHDASGRLLRTYKVMKAQ
jgi:hypothetical protein